MIEKSVRKPTSSKPRSSANCKDQSKSSPSTHGQVEVTADFSTMPTRSRNHLLDSWTQLHRELTTQRSPFPSIRADRQRKRVPRGKSSPASTLGALLSLRPILAASFDG